MISLHELTAPELTSLRTGSHWSQPMLVIPETPVVFQALINQTFSSRNRIFELVYDTVSFGSYTEVKPQMTLLIGTSAGAADIGVVRIRKAPTSTKIFIGQVSDIRFANNLHLTVIRDYGLFTRLPYFNPTTATQYMDRDVAYSDQHSDWQPFVNMGSDRVIDIRETTAVVFDASAWCPGSTITSWSWVSSGGVLTDATTSTPTLTVSTIGTYQLDCTVTAANGKSFTGHRVVVVISDENVITDFSIESSPSWDFSRGGCEFSVRMRSGATLRDRQRVFLVSRNFYNGIETNISQIPGGENIVAAGWISGESLTYGSEDDSVAFDVLGSHYWLGNQQDALVDLTNTGSAAAATWSEISGMTVDKALYHVLQWRSTAAGILDISLTGDTRQTQTFQEQIAPTWDQMVSIAQRIRAVILTDVINGFYAFIEPQAIPEADRGSIPVIMDITKPDWETLSIERVTVDSAASLRLVGEQFVSTSLTKSLHAVATGDTPKRFGLDDGGGDSVIVTGQSQLNSLAGLALGSRNNPYPEIIIDLAQYNPAITGVPAQYVSLTLEAADNPRGVPFDSLLIPRVITHEWDGDNGCFLTSLTCEAACVAELAIKDTVPAEEPPPAYVPPVIVPPLPPIPEYVPAVSRIGVLLVRDDIAGIFYSDEADEAAPRWKENNAGLPYVGTGIFSLMPTGSKNLVVSYGAVYADQDTYPNSGLWGTPLGGTFQQILSHAEIQATIGDTGDYYYLWTATSPVNDSVAVIAQHPTKLPWLFVGTSAGGFIAGVELPVQLRTNEQWSSFSYGDGRWRITRYNYWDPVAVTRVLNISPDGSTITYDSGIAANEWPSGHYRAIPSPSLGTGPGIWFLDNYKLSVDNGLTWTTTLNTIPTNPFGGRATNTNRNIVIWGSDTPLSTDGGVTWNLMPGLPGLAWFSKFAFYPGEVGEWLASVTGYGLAPSGVYNSLDDGITWNDKTGDLLAVMGVTSASIVDLFGI